MDEQASDFRGVTLELGFKTRDEFMHARHGEVVWQRAVAGDLDERIMIM